MSLNELLVGTIWAQGGPRNSNSIYGVVFFTGISDMDLFSPPFYGASAGFEMTSSNC